MNALHRTLQKLVDEAVEKQKHKTYNGGSRIFM